MHKISDQEWMDWIKSELLGMDKKMPVSKKELHALYQLFTIFFERLTDTGSISFTSLFPRMVYAFVQYKFDKRLLRANHYFRIRFESAQLEESEIQSLFFLGCQVMWHNLNFLSNVKIPETFAGKIEIEDYNKSKSKFQRIIRCLIFDCDEQNTKIRIRYFSEEEPHLSKLAYLKNKDFAKQLLKFKAFVPFPISASLVDVSINDEGIEVGAVVFKPDFLIGVTTISECFQNGNSLAISALSRKLIPTESSVHLLMGNVVNFIFDELIHDIDTELEDLLIQIFNNAAVDFALMSDDVLKDFLEKLKLHYANLKRLIGHELEQTGISPSSAFLEPSFYSSEYGLQGRLDLYHFDKKDKHSHIVELKSGKLFKPNSYGLNENHYVQTMLYDLLIESVHAGKVKSNNYILYSYLDAQNLRFAPKLRSKQLDALYLRNDIILLEDLLSSGDTSMVSKLIAYLRPERIPDGFNFLSRDARHFNTVYEALTKLEKSYYLNFISFINREYQLSKTGEHGLYSSNGLASLWLDTLEDKMDKFMILAKLRITENNAHAYNPLVTLEFTEKSSRLSRFRRGDIAVLYPDTNAQRSVLSHQIFKCSIVKMEGDKLVVRLRARQKNHEAFDSYSFWNLEADSLDSSFLKQYHGMFRFIGSNPIIRRMLMGIEPPAKPDQKITYTNERLNKTQNAIIEKAIAAKDYFLLWGPPGTGKTSVMLHALVDYYYNHSKANILLLAYTNKAVDEICDSVGNLLDGNYIRIGSRYSTGEAFQSHLLSQILEKVNSRKEVQGIIKNKRVFVSTLSSFQGREGLLKLKKFDIVIIDEASQILEPMLVGLLPRIEKFILIGDHKQLPAVVAQEEEICLIQDEELNTRCGLVNMSDSLFERLFRRCRSESWDWAYAALKNQGRMHEDILKFVSHTFYDSGLGIIEGITRLTEQAKFIGFDALSEILIHNRMIFIDTPIDESVTHKTNREEAEMVAGVLDHWMSIYKFNDTILDENKFGIITPFRSQIALLRGLLNDNSKDLVSIDTVERYQGGSRDHIFISLAVSKAQLLESISNVSSEGIDRKLNVALTRARENVIIFGNKNILSQNTVYKSLIEYCYSLSYSDIEIIRKNEGLNGMPG